MITSDLLKFELSGQVLADLLTKSASGERWVNSAGSPPVKNPQIHGRAPARPVQGSVLPRADDRARPRAGQLPCLRQGRHSALHGGSAIEPDWLRLLGSHGEAMINAMATPAANPANGLSVCARRGRSALR